MKIPSLLSLLAYFRQRDIEFRPDGDGLIVRPASKLTAGDRSIIRAHKGELLTLLRAEQDRAQALALLNRLKTFALPAGRIHAAGMIAEGCSSRLVQGHDGEPVDEADYPASILVVLREVERELIALGGAPDPELADVVRLVTADFPGARLIEVCNLR